MIEEIFPIIIMSFTFILIINFYYQYGKLRNLLKKHNKPTACILYNLGILNDIKSAKSLIKDLEDNKESLEVKAALKKTDISFAYIFVGFFGLGMIFLLLIK